MNDAMSLARWATLRHPPSENERNRMNNVLEVAANSSFLQEAVKRGYKPFFDPNEGDQHKEFPGLYLGSVQKRVTDEIGTRYFITMTMFDMGQLPTKMKIPFKPSATVQFHVKDGFGQTINVEVSDESIDVIEQMLDDIWTKVGYGYYERSA